MKRKLLQVLALGLTVVLAVSCGSSKPVRFESKAGKFAVMSPVTLGEDSRAIETPGGTVTLHMFMGERNDVSYGIMYCDYGSVTLPEMTLEERLDGGRDGAVANVGGHLISEKSISLDGNPGRDISVGTSKYGAEGICRARIFAVGKKLYQMIVAGPAASMNDPQIDQFLQSLELLK